MILPMRRKGERQSQTPLAHVRRARTLTQAQLASLAGIHQTDICKAERGKLQLRWDVQIRIATILGASTAELFPVETEVVA